MITKIRERRELGRVFADVREVQEITKSRNIQQTPARRIETALLLRPTNLELYQFILTSTGTSSLLSAASEQQPSVGLRSTRRALLLSSSMFLDTKLGSESQKNRSDK